MLKCKVQNVQVFLQKSKSDYKIGILTTWLQAGEDSYHKNAITAHFEYLSSTDKTCFWSFSLLFFQAHTLPVK